MKERIKYSALSSYGTMLKKGNETLWRCECCGRMHTLEEFRANEFMLEYPQESYQKAGSIVFCAQCKQPLYYALSPSGIITTFLLVDITNDKKEEIFNGIKKYNASI